MKIGIILATALLILSMLATGCAVDGNPLSGPVKQTGTNPAMGTLQVLVTDAPPDREVTSIMVTVKSVEVHQAVAEQEQSTPTPTPTDTAETDGEAEWLPVGILEGKETFDLLQVAGLEEVLATTELEAGKYTQIRMTIDKVQVGLDDGDPQDATLPSGKLKFVQPFEIIAGQTTALLFDFDAEKSVNITGSDKIMVKPVIKLSITKPKAIGSDLKSTASGLKITTLSLPDGLVDASYDAVLAASGGTAPYTWSIDSGTLPEDVALDPDTGAVSGTPVTAADYTFTVKVSDGSTPVKSDAMQYTITIVSSDSLIITTTSLPNGVKGSTYDATIDALGGTAPYTWSLASGSLPDGLDISSDGVISGIPTKNGKFDFTIEVTDTSSPAKTDTQQFSIRVTGG